MPDFIFTTRSCTRDEHVGGRELPESSFRWMPTVERFHPHCRECESAARSARRVGGNRSSRRLQARKFGVEVEFVGISREVAKHALRAAGIRVYEHPTRPDYNHTVPRNAWKVVSDGSLYSHESGEMVSPPLKGANGLAQLKTALAALNAAGARVNQQCGLHVHHDCGDMTATDLGNLARGWYNAQRATNGLVARSRRDNRWAQNLQLNEVERVESLTTADREDYTLRSTLGYIDRYRTINFNAFPKYGTVEIRQHQGTTNYKKIAAWIAFGQAFIASAKSGDTAVPASTTDLVERMARHGLDSDSAAYLARRASAFQGRRAVA